MSATSSSAKLAVALLNALLADVRNGMMISSSISTLLLVMLRIISPKRSIAIPAQFPPLETSVNLKKNIKPIVVPNASSTQR